MTIRPFRVALILVATVVAGCGTGSAPASTPAPASAPAPTSTARVVATGQTAITPQLIARGDTVFHASSCTECHGRLGKGSPHGPDLTSGQWVQTDGSYEQIIKIITSGIPVDKITDPTFPEPMPARGGDKPPLTDDRIRALAAYVYSLSHR